MRIRLISLSAGAAALIGAAAGVGTAAATPSASTPTRFAYVCGVGAEKVEDWRCVTRSTTGDRIELTVAGSFATDAKSISGGGAFIRWSRDGRAVQGTGTWTAEQLVRFTPYGDGSAQGEPSQFWGGEALIRVRLSTGQRGVLSLVCRVGHPPKNALEGFGLRLDRGPDFNRPVNGETGFAALP